MIDTYLFITSIAIAVIGLFTIGFVPSGKKAATNLFFVIITALSTSIPAIHVIINQPVEFTLYNFWFFGDIPIRIDALSAWFILIINFTCINGALYGIGYMKSYSEQKANLTLHWILFLMFQSSMLWVCVIQHSVGFLIAWEIMSVSSFLLVIFEHNNKKTLKAGINYLVQMHISVAMLTAAFIWAYCATGSFDFISISHFFSLNPNIWLFLLFFIGFGIKAGFIPFHSWLPHAHPAAPSHISGVMSGVIVKLGIYGIFRMITFLKQDFLIIGEAILTLSVLSGLYGILNAAVHRDFKRMLAYCTIENIGIIGSGIGMGLIGMGTGNSFLIVFGFAGALLHTLNHSLFKSLLFFCAGSIYQQTHTRDMEKLGGLLKRMPQTGILFLLGALAIGGLPPFNGFVSEFILYIGYLEGIKSLDIANSTLMIFSLASLALIGGISILTFTKSFGTIFLGNARTHLDHQPREVTTVMLIPQYLILTVMISIGLFPQLYFITVLKTIIPFLPSATLSTITNFIPMIDIVASVGKNSLIFMGVVMLIYLMRRAITRNRPVTTNATWGCGYTAQTPRIQYTGKSFSKTLGKLFSFVTIEQKKYEEIEPKEIFPLERRHSSHYIDFFENKIINGLMKKLVYSMNYFQFVQNGKTQAYVLYGVFFILLVFLGTLFKII
jgi:formate hydrogenlyase subunit 3/multisubunit Na+/H+ antiporter MnhD subunit